MISQLAGCTPEQLRVIGRNSVMGYKHQVTSAWTRFGRELSASVCAGKQPPRSGTIARHCQLCQVQDQTLYGLRITTIVPNILKSEDDVLEPWRGDPNPVDSATASRFDSRASRQSRSLRRLYGRNVFFRPGQQRRSEEGSKRYEQAIN